MVKTPVTVNSPLGEISPDYAGTAVGAVRLNPAQSYQAIPLLLQKYINEGNREAWEEIVKRIDFTSECARKALEALDRETGFSGEIKARIAKGQRLLFKPNLVNPNSIEPAMHGPGTLTTMTPWSFVAALMRWFHDELGITYHQMSLGEASTTMSAVAGTFTKLAGRTITTLAVMEGKAGDFYGGWGFYFIRKYLAEIHTRGHKDDPLRGYEESLAGVCLPPGKAPDKLLVYDINKIDDDRCNGREVNVPGGINFKSVILHKAIIGGEPANAQDRKDWPGCVLINVPKLKLHVLELITGAVKNLGVGLYPMEVNTSLVPGCLRWKYAQPPDKPVPGMKSLIPHQPWFAQHDEKTGAPLLDENGRVKMKKTGGMSATMADVLSAVKDQDVSMLHIVEAIEATNGGQAGPNCTAVPEGYIFTSRDPVAVDALCVNYLFKNIPIVEARRAQKEHSLSTDFVQKVPLPKAEGRNIIIGEGYDSPIPRYHAFKHCQDRGIGQQMYYVVGEDVWEGGRLVSLQGHFGRVVEGKFTELFTKELYFATGKPLWDLQVTTLAYAEANDRLTGSDYKAGVLAELDENGDGVIDYDEKGRGGGTGIDFGALGVRMQALDIDTLDMLKLRFLFMIVPMRMTNPAWNLWKIGMSNRVDVNAAFPFAMRLARSPVETPDPVVPGMSFGKGKLPSIQYARSVMQFAAIYGAGFPNFFDVVMNPYGLAFRYAALKWGGSQYRALNAPMPMGDFIGPYHKAIASGEKALPFTFYAPPGFGKANGGAIPNVVETDDPHLILTAEFDGGREKWQELNWEEIP